MLSLLLFRGGGGLARRSKAPLTSLQAVNRARRKPRASVIRIHPVGFAPSRKVARAVQVLTAVELVRARLKRLTAKTRLVKVFGRPTARKVRAVAVVNAVELVKARLKRLTAKPRFDTKVFGRPTTKPPVRTTKVLHQSNSHTARRQTHSVYVKPHGGVVAVVAQLLPVPVSTVCSNKKRLVYARRCHGSAKLVKPNGGVVAAVAQLLPVPVSAVCANKKRLVYARRAHGTAKIIKPILAVAQAPGVQLLPVPVNAVCSKRKRIVYGRRFHSAVQLRKPFGGVVSIVTPHADPGDGWRRHRGFDLAEWKRRKRPEKKLEADLLALYRELTEGGVEEAAEIVRPFARSEQGIIPAHEIDWKALMRDLPVVQELYALQRFLDDEDDIEFLLLNL